MRSVRQTRRVAVAVVAVTCSGALLLAIVFTPSLTRWASSRRDDWEVLSYVGQSYGGISAILSAFALCAIAVSIVLQWRQTRVALIHAASSKHFELVRLAIENEQISASTGLSQSQFAQRAYANLSVAHWLMIWELGIMDSARVTRAAADLFEGVEARLWWKGMGRNWPTAQTQRNREFTDLIQAGHDLAAIRIAEASVNRRSGDERIRNQSRTRLTATAAALGSGTLAAIAVRAFVRHRRLRSPRIRTIPRRTP